MAYDFANSPSVGQIATGAGGVQFVWDGTKWKNGTSVPTYTNVGRNLLHNPLFTVAQRALPVTATGYTLDRWRAEIVTDTASFSQAALTDADRTAIGDEEAVNALQNVFTGNAAAGAYGMIHQRVETPRRLSGKTVTVSFWAKAASGTPKLGISIDQVWNGVATTGTGTAVTLSTTWTRYTTTITIPGGTGKTQVLADYTQLNLWFSSGSTNATRAGTVGVQSATIQLWGIQLEIGSVATPLEKPDPRYDLANCQRFYQRNLLAYHQNTNSAGTAVVISGAFLGPMRAAPTLGLINNNSVNMTAPGLATNGVGWWTAASVVASATYTLYVIIDASADL
jgi:Carbohydrate binding domain